MFLHGRVELVRAVVGDAREALEAAFPKLPFTWLEVAAGDEFVFLLRREDLA